MLTEALSQLETKSAKVELYSLEKYKKLTGIEVQFNDSEYFAALLRAGDHIPYIFEQPTDKSNIIIHTVLLVGDYEAIVAGEIYLKAGEKEIEEVLPSRFADHKSVTINYKVGTSSRSSEIGYDPRRTKPVGIKFRAKDL
jgi:hypothetical protein